MSIAKSMDFHATQIAPTTPKGVMVISAMPSYRIVWFLMKRHKVGILATLAVVGFTYDSLLPFAARELFHLLFR